MNDNELIDRHHLLEIILWPNGDGTFRTILNSKERLKELGIYDDFKLTIPLTRSEHARLHMAGRTLSGETKKKLSESAKCRQFSDETRKKISESKKGKPSNRKGIKLSEETKKKMSEAQKGKPRGPMSVEARKKISEAQKAYWKNRKKMEVFEND